MWLRLFEACPFEYVGAAPAFDAAADVDGRPWEVGPFHNAFDAVTVADA